ncbi:MAG: DUF4230 domain-containing protein [Prevotella sp.]|nr:DUF4230 domain-containing protein [Prevotella sp.]
MSINPTIKTLKSIAILAVILLLGGGIWWLWRQPFEPAAIEHGNRIDFSPQQIQSIRDIGQWEFLAITDEELVDTTRRRLFSDDHLAHIYYGTLRLGIDLQQLKDEWVVVRQDTIFLTLPPVGLLDQHFIDEARTRSFFEAGRWSAADREAMYRRAERLMRAHALTPQNLKTAEANAEEQVRKLMHTMGYNEVIISFAR